MVSRQEAKEQRGKGDRQGRCRPVLWLVSRSRLLDGCLVREVGLVEDLIEAVAKQDHLIMA